MRQHATLIGLHRYFSGHHSGRWSASLLAALMLFVLPVALVHPVKAQPAATASRGLPDFADLVESAGPAVVNIRTVEKVRVQQSQSGPQIPELDENDPFYEFFRRFFPPRPNAPRGPRGAPQPEEVPRGVGSGFIISQDGFILTNHHVVDGADEILVTLADKREFKARLIGSDRRTDVALVKINVTGLPSLRFGDPNKLRVGEWVLAIGSPFGLENTVTAGIVSAKGRDTGDYLPFIQTDVAVNPGNSGGPLLNMRGEVVGINSQIYSRTGGFMGISFAIPIDEANRVAEQLRTQGRVTRGRIGVGIGEVTKEVAEALGLSKTSGALVRSVESGGPAEKAGLEPGDILLRFDGKVIDKSSDLPRIVGNTKPGARVTAQVWRKGGMKELTVSVGEMEPDRVAKAAGKPAPTTPSVAANWIGLAVVDLTEARRTELKIKAGVLVEVADGAAARAGIRQGDVLISVNNTDITSAKQFGDVVNKLDKTKPLVALVRRGDGALFIPVRPTATK
ncbi:MAG: DegQ family serine endoprotease [Burkholderiaceae bacterium]|jgi:serine protease Do|nr:DegQ family serine endoprotease [Burkholderiaceae bacterium]